MFTADKQVVASLAPLVLVGRSHRSAYPRPCGFTSGLKQLRKSACRCMYVFFFCRVPCVEHWSLALVPCPHSAVWSPPQSIDRVLALMHPSASKSKPHSRLRRLAFFFLLPEGQERPRPRFAMFCFVSVSASASASASASVALEWFHTLAFVSFRSAWLALCGSKARGRVISSIARGHYARALGRVRLSDE